MSINEEISNDQGADGISIGKYVRNWFIDRHKVYKDIKTYLHRTPPIQLTEQERGTTYFIMVII